MSEINHNPDLEKQLAQDGRPAEFGFDQNELLNDPAESLNRGLTNLYYKYIDEVAKRKKERLISDDKVKDLVTRIDELSVRDLGFEVSKYTTIERAKEIMGPKMFFGPEEVKQAFGIEITEQIPPIPFPPNELDRAKELGQFLVLRIDQTADGQPLTMEKIDQLVQPKFDRDGKGKVLLRRDGHKTKSFFTSQTPTMGWALTTRETIPGSKYENYFEQTNALVAYLETQVFADETMPSEYRDAIIQFAANKEEIKRLMQGSFTAATQNLSELRINQLTRQSAVEVLYDKIIYFQNTNERILRSERTWTNSLDFDGHLVYVGDADYLGNIVEGQIPGYSDNHLGTLFSRTK